MFKTLFGTTWTKVIHVEESLYYDELNLFNQIIHGKNLLQPFELEKRCTLLCKNIQYLANWGKQQPISYDGLADLEINLATPKMSKNQLYDKENIESHFSHNFQQRWIQFKSQLKKYNQQKSE